MSYRTRKRGHPNQIGNKFPVKEPPTKESLPKLDGSNMVIVKNKKKRHLERPFVETNNPFQTETPEAMEARRKELKAIVAETEPTKKKEKPQFSLADIRRFLIEKNILKTAEQRRMDEIVKLLHDTESGSPPRVAYAKFVLSQKYPTVTNRYNKLKAIMEEN
ncbi:MAG: hypothetical protein ACTSW1_15585 [Candidatus Hodarchaeales archaeon]